MAHARAVAASLKNEAAHREGMQRKLNESNLRTLLRLSVAMLLRSPTWRAGC